MGGGLYGNYFTGESFGGGGIPPPLGSNTYTTLPTPLNFAGETFATFLNDEIFPRIIPHEGPPPPPVSHIRVNSTGNYMRSPQRCHLVANEPPPIPTPAPRSKLIPV